jgi:hypothetical protein
MFENLTGNWNTAVGYASLASNTSGSSNTALGYRALQLNSTGARNTAVGYNAGDGFTNETDNTVIGYDAGAGSGDYLTAVGSGALNNVNTTGSVGVGYFAGYQASTGNVTAVGYEALRTTNAVGSTALGYEAARASITNPITAVGYQAMKASTSGLGNTALGYQALTAQTTGSSNTAIGHRVLASFTGAGGNTAVGYLALEDCTTGGGNTVVGNQAAQNVTTGANNVIIGSGAAGALTTQSNNAFIGPETFDISTVSSSVALGYRAGYAGGATVYTGSNLVCIGTDSTPSAAAVNNQITLGNSAITQLRCQVTTITSLSDARDKKNVEALPVGLEFVKSLQPVKFDWDTRDGAKKDIPATGFLAQDLDSAAKTTGIEEYLDLVSHDNPDRLEARYGNLIPVLVQAVKDLAAVVADLQNQLNNRL